MVKGLAGIIILGGVLISKRNLLSSSVMISWMELKELGEMHCECLGLPFVTSGPYLHLAF